MEASEMDANRHAAPMELEAFFDLGFYKHAAPNGALLGWDENASTSLA